MQTRREMLANRITANNYKALTKAGRQATLCRGTADADFDFFYSSDPLWADQCAGWLPYDGAVRICSACAQHKKPVVKINNNDLRFESRDSDRIPGRSSKPSGSRSSKVSTLRKSEKHSSKSAKSNPTVKNKKISKVKRASTKTKSRKQ